MTRSTVPVRQGFDQRRIDGPFDIVGDVHGCADELLELLGLLGWRIGRDGRGAIEAAPPPGRQAIFVGDLVDRGPKSPDVLRIVMALTATGLAHCVPGNHDVRLQRWLDGRQVRLSHGLDRTAAQLATESDEFLLGVKAFLAGLPPYLWLAQGSLAVAHAGIKAHMIGRASREIESFCLYGETSGEMDSFGLPVRYHWGADYEGEAEIVYGHTPVPEAGWVGRTLCLDTGCCFGGRLSALRWPEREIVSVPAREVYAASMRPFGHPPVRPKP